MKPAKGHGKSICEATADNLLSCGNMIRAARKHRRLTQARLAEKSCLSAKMISLVERGQRNVSWITVSRILEALRFRVVFVPAESHSSSEGDDMRHKLWLMMPDLRALAEIIEQLDASMREDIENQRR